MFGRTYWMLGQDPFRELHQLQRGVDRLFSNMRETWGIEEYPALNALSGKESVIVTAELPGINPDKLNIAVHNDTLSISGSRDIEKLKEGEVYHRQERSHGQFSRTIKLPFNANADKVDASYKKGVLSITLHRSEADKPKKIVIKSE